MCTLCGRTRFQDKLVYPKAKLVYHEIEIHISGRTGIQAQVELIETVKISVLILSNITYYELLYLFITRHALVYNYLIFLQDFLLFVYK